MQEKIVALHVCTELFDSVQKHFCCMCGGHCLIACENTFVVCVQNTACFHAGYGMFDNVRNTTCKMEFGDGQGNLLVLQSLVCVQKSL